MNPDQLTQKKLQARQLWQGRQATAALALYQEICAHDASDLEAWVCQGAIHGQLQQYARAQHCCRSAIALDPACAVAWLYLANALRADKQPEAAAQAYREAIKANPGYDQAFGNLGNVLLELGDAAGAVEAHRKVVTLNPGHALAHYNLGVALRTDNRLEDALESYRTSCRLDPGLAAGWNNCGHVLRQLARYREALDCFERALALEPDHAPAHFEKSLALLVTGRLAEGWREYRWRLDTPEFADLRAATGILGPPRWEGQQLEQGTLLLVAEQGFGDMIQFVRLVPLAKKRCRRVIVHCKPELADLFRSMPDIDALLVGDHTVLQDAAFDCYLPMLDLPGLLDITLDNIPADTPYLAAKPADCARWQQRLGDADGLRIGLAWAGRPSHQNDRARSLRLEHLSGLSDVPGVRLFSLQKGPSEDQLDPPPAGMNIQPLGHELSSFADTAALVSALDLVITVDTSVAHLAGALGKPVWVLLPHAPDWRWLLDREDSPWYPRMRLFRQARAGDWDTVISRVIGELEKQAGGE